MSLRYVRRINCAFIFPNRCICPEGTFGSRCKILSRSFQGTPKSGAWAWLPTLKPCSKLSISFQLSTRTSNCVVFSSVSSSEQNVGIEFRLTDGKPLFRMALGEVVFHLRIDTAIDDGSFHQLDVSWQNQVTRIV